MGQSKFKDHRLSEPEMVWLSEAIKPDFKPKVVRVRLWNELPEGFDPKTIDRRFYVNDRVTPLGRWKANSKDPLFERADRVARAVRSAIIDDPEEDQIVAENIARSLQITPEQAGEALYFLGELGGFSASANGKTGAYEYVSIGVGNEDVQTQYLRYKTIEDELERYYVDRGHPAYLDPRHMFRASEIEPALQQSSEEVIRNPWRRLGRLYSKHEASFKATALILTVAGALSALATGTWGLLHSQLPDVQIRLASPERPVLVLENSSDVTASQIKYAFALVKISGPDIGQLVPIPTGIFDFINGHARGGPQILFDFPGMALLEGQKMFGWAMVTCPACARARYYYTYMRLGHGGWYAEVSEQRHREIARQLEARGPYSGDDADSERVQSVVPLADRIAIEKLQ